MAYFYGFNEEIANVIGRFLGTGSGEFDQNIPLIMVKQGHVITVTKIEFLYCATTSSYRHLHFKLLDLKP
jgi:hypothetical protein